MARTKLKDLLTEVFENEQPKIDKKKVLEGVSEYGNIGKQLYNSVNINKLAEQLVQIAESAHDHVLSETDTWFDSVSINRNMKGLKSTVKEFKKTANEYSTLGQRLTALYEEMGTTLNRYYEINEESEGQEEYQAFFRKTAEKFGHSPEEIDNLPDNEKKEFYNYIEKHWTKDTK